MNLFTTTWNLPPTECVTAGHFSEQLFNNFSRGRGLDRVISSETETFELQDRDETETFEIRDRDP